MSGMTDTGAMPADTTSKAGSHRRKRSSGWFRPRVAAVVALVLCVGLVGGYVLFLSQVHGLAERRDPTRADGIVVLTGGYNRLESASMLMRNGKATRLLVSGVNTDLGRDDLKAALNLDDAMFNCCVDIDYVALDTIGNASQGHEWARRNGFRSLIIVTNDYHMPRSLMEMHRVSDTIEIIPHAVVNPAVPGEPFSRKLDRHRVLGVEYLKYLLSLVSGVLPGTLTGAGNISAASMQTGW